MSKNPFLNFRDAWRQGRVTRSRSSWEDNKGEKAEHRDDAQLSDLASVPPRRLAAILAAVTWQRSRRAGTRPRGIHPPLPGKISRRSPRRLCGRGADAVDATPNRSSTASWNFRPSSPISTRAGTLWETPFANGKTYADCFADGGRNVAGDYPHFDAASGKVVTFEMAMNAAGAQWREGIQLRRPATMGVLTAHARSLSDGMRMNIKVEGSGCAGKVRAGQALLFHPYRPVQFRLLVLPLCARRADPAHRDHLAQHADKPPIGPCSGRATTSTHCTFAPALHGADARIAISRRQ